MHIFNFYKEYIRHYQLYVGTNIQEHVHVLYINNVSLRSEGSTAANPRR